MPRGRPRKVPVEPVEPDSVELEVAQMLAERCGVPGCLPKNHLVEAQHLVVIMKKRFNLSE